MPDETRSLAPRSQVTPPDCPTVEDAAPATAPIGAGAAGTLLTPPLAAGDAFTLLSEIARGGMGIVYRARDNLLGRDVAVKLLRDQLPPGSPPARRFLDEARITGQLQHPGIPPIYQCGTLPDGRPFLAMKLIKGETLADLLKAGTGADRSRFAAAFEQVCHAVGYAHAHGVIHRDLKPANVMVGAFGEVQVMDWGLAKVLGNSPTAPALTDEDETGSVIHSERDTGFETRAGSILGTPAFMPPEQAIGAIDQIDARSDVFGLGAILAVILTGQPPFVGANAESTRQLAARGRVEECFARLDASGAEAELVALCKRCLSPEKANRPAHAGDVARAVGELRAAADERARRAELDRAKAEVEAREQRKRRHVQLTLATAIGLLLAAGGGVAWYADHQANGRKLAEERAETEQRLKAAQAHSGAKASLALAGDLRKKSKFREAAAALAQATELATASAPELLPQIEQARQDLNFVTALDDVRFRKWIYVEGPAAGRENNTKIAAPEYQQAFATHGLELTTVDPAVAARRIETSAVKAELVAAVDDWALFEPDQTIRDRLLAIARLADRDPWRDRLRDPESWKTLESRERLVADANPVTTPPQNLIFLVVMLSGSGVDVVPLLSAARVAHPTDFELAFALGLSLYKDRKSVLAVGPYEAARAIRPEVASVWLNLGGIYCDEKKEYDQAIAYFEKAIQLAPKNALGYRYLGVALMRKGDANGAIAANREALKLDPAMPEAHCNLGLLLRESGRLEEALAELRMGDELGRKQPGGWGYPSETWVAECERELAAEKGRTVPPREVSPAVALDRKNAASLYFQARGLAARGDNDGAIGKLEEATRLDPDNVSVLILLGSIYCDQQGKHDQAITYFEKAIRLVPKDSLVHKNLGVARHRSGDTNGAIAAYREALKLDPAMPEAHCNLGLLLQKRGQLEEALAELRMGDELGRKQPGWAYPSKWWVAECERALERRAPPPREVKRP